MKISVFTNKTSIWNNFFVLVLFLTPFYTPGSFSIIAPTLDKLFDIWRIIVIIISVALYLLYHKISGIMLAIGTYEAIKLLSTIIYGGDFATLVASCGTTIGMCMIIELGMQHNVKKILFAQVAILTFLCLINLGTIILFPDGMIPDRPYNWFLGYDNLNCLYVIPLLCYYAIYANLEGYTLKRKIVFMGLNASMLFLTWTVTGIIGVTVFFILFIISERKHEIHLLNIRMFYAIVIILFFAIIIFRVQYLFKYIIVDILKKNLTFGRLNIWDNALRLFIKSPILGNGVTSVDINYIRLKASHAHNQYLFILYQTGIIGMTSFLAILLMIMKPLRTEGADKYTLIFSGTIFCFLLMFLDEAYNEMPFFGIVTMSYHINKVFLADKDVKKDGEVKARKG